MNAYACRFCGKGEGKINSTLDIEKYERDMS